MRPLKLARLVPFALAAALAGCATPRVVLISLDGAAPYLVESLTEDGTLPADRGLGALGRAGRVARANVTANPSLTAVSHVAIATGSTPARNDIVANTFRLHASPFASNVSGFSAPIGGYAFSPQGSRAAEAPAAEPLWVTLRAAGKRVVAATWPGADGQEVRAPGLGASAPVLQPASRRVTDYTVPYGVGALGARGYALAAADFELAEPAVREALRSAGLRAFGAVYRTREPVEQMEVGGQEFLLHLAAFDSTDDGHSGFDTVVVYDAQVGVRAGPHTLPSTGPAVLRFGAGASQRFYLEGSANRAGTAFYLTRLERDLSMVRVVRYGASFLPRRAAIAPDVDDVNASVGFWAPQPDFRIVERLVPSLKAFADDELEAVYLDQVRTFVDYQVRVLLHAIERVPDADLVMGYVEQPDGAGHQFLMTDPRQASDPRDPGSTGANQDADKRKRYRRYVGLAYQAANDAVQRVVERIGTDRAGVPRRNVIVVSDHGMAPFHTAVDLPAWLASQRIDPKAVRAVTSGPAVNIYMRLEGRDAGGIVKPGEFRSLQARVVLALRTLIDRNPRYAEGPTGTSVVDQVAVRPTPDDPADPAFGLMSDDALGQDAGDVYAVLAPGYNFDGAQSPRVARRGDAPEAVFSIPNFYGAHGYDPQLRTMHAIFFAAGPQVCRGVLDEVRNIDVAPTILKLLGVAPSKTVEGRAIELCPGAR